MAAIDELIQQIQDPILRERIRTEVEDLSKQKKFGLVFENHLPEHTPLYEMPIKVGSLVMPKLKKGDDLFTVKAINGDDAIVVNKSSGEESELPLRSLVVAAELGEPIYPYLKYVDSISRAPDEDLWHVLIEADNYHALQLLEYLYAGKVDCIYIDPPYNTGAKDWKYNNDYVDSTDTYQHSKWLSMMEKRLLIAKKLLKPANSVLIVAIDEKEYLHLGCLLEQLFPNADIEMVTSVVNARGKQRVGKFAKTEEYIFFVKIGAAFVHQENDPDYQEGSDVPWRTMRRSSLAGARGVHGPGACGPNQFFPVYVSDDGLIVDIGMSIPEDQDVRGVQAPAGTTAVFPIRDDGTEMNWGITDASAKELWKKGYIRVGRFTPNKPQKWELSYLTSGKIEDIETGRATIVGHNKDGSVKAKYVQTKLKAPSSVWVKPLHNAETEGTNLLKEIFDGESRFPYPKSLYAVKDCLAYFVIDNPNALIVDFFAGSGTTMHAVNLLNAIDGGERRCIMVTNNEVSEKEEKKLAARGLYPGDPEWDRLGIAQFVNWPRTKCSISGLNISGNPLHGNYKDSRSISLASGFDTNVIYYKLGFLDKTSIALGRQFRELLPIIWMKSGCHQKCPSLEGGDVPSMLVLPNNRFAVLINESFFGLFAAEVEKYPEIETVYIVTNSDIGYQEMAMAFEDKQTYQLYRDYLDNFRLNVRK